MTDVPDPTPTVDPREKVEVSTASGDQSPAVARAGGGATPPEQLDASDAEGPEGTAAGDPLAGVTITEDDAAHAVPADTGPESQGSR